MLPSGIRLVPNLYSPRWVLNRAMFWSPLCTFLDVKNDLNRFVQLRAVDQTQQMCTQNGSCIICYESSPPPMQSGCGCRGDNGLAHHECLAKKAVYQPHRGDASWRSCQTCLLPFTGEMRKELAIAWLAFSRERYNCDGAEHVVSDGELDEAVHFGNAQRDGRDAIGMSRRDEFMRAVSHMFGCILDDDNKGLIRAGSLCWWYGWYDSVALIMFFVREHVRPESIPRTNISLVRPFELTMDNLRTATSRVIKPTDLEQVIGWMTSAQYDRKALVFTGHLAMALSNMDRFQESNRLFKVVFGEMVNVFGSRHPSTMQIGQHYALSLYQQGLY